MSRSPEKKILEKLAAEYPQLYLNPDTDTLEMYRYVVLQGGEPKSRTLAHYSGSTYDRLEMADTPAVPVKMATLGNRRDFELVIRGLMAAKDGPLARIPLSQGAAMLTVFNWPRIKSHLAAFPADAQDAEFRRFTSVKENYLDTLAVLSRGPYSHVDASAAGHSEDEWLALSDTIRKYHELTHVICRKKYPGDIDPVKDELIADAVGLYAAFGRYDPEMEKLFLGIRDGQYIGGRLENYTDNPQELSGFVLVELARIKEVCDAPPGVGPFELIPLLMSKG